MILFVIACLLVLLDQILSPPIDLVHHAMLVNQTPANHKREYTLFLKLFCKFGPKTDHFDKNGSFLHDYFCISKNTPYGI